MPTVKEINDKFQALWSWVPLKNGLYFLLYLHLKFLHSFLVKAPSLGLLEATSYHVSLFPFLCHSLLRSLSSEIQIRPLDCWKHCNGITPWESNSDSFPGLRVPQSLHATHLPPTVTAPPCSLPSSHAGFLSVAWTPKHLLISEPLHLLLPLGIFFLRFAHWWHLCTIQDSVCKVLLWGLSWPANLR